jgi:hypothetical protein
VRLSASAASHHGRHDLPAPGVRWQSIRRRKREITELVVVATVAEKGLQAAEVFLSSVGICSAVGITAAVLESRPLRVIELWGFRGTAMGCLVGLPLALAVLARS